MVACQLESEEEEKKMVTIAVIIEEELLSRIDASLRLEEELTQRETGELEFYNRDRIDDFQSMIY